MSKASEWAAHIADHTRPRFSEGWLEAEVDDHGHLHLESSSVDVAAHSAERAVRFARWILDTFGETP